MKTNSFYLGVCLCLLASVFHTTASASDYVGTLPGSFAVSPSGAATYTIPIEVPPGVNGMQPDLAFVYDSQAGNGEMGVGWGLSGLSAITRCPSNYEQDGEIRGVKVDHGDKFCLNGQRLILTSGNYGEPNSEYKTNGNSVVKVVARNNTGYGPAHFEVYHNDGTISVYGASVNSRHYNINETYIYEWNLSEIKDPLKNSIIYNYGTDFSLGIHLLTSIIYSDYVIEFGWGEGPRDDRFDGYFAPLTKSAIHNRLSSINIKAGQSTSYSYLLDYDYMTGKSVLTGLRKCRSLQSLTCLEPKQFVWSAVNSHFDSAWDTHDIGGFYGDKYIADVNGDGRSDIVHLWNNNGGLAISVYESDGKAFKTSWWTHQLDSAGFPGDKYIADVNGDGLSDIVHLWNNNGKLGISVYESDGKAFKTSGQTHQLDNAGFYGDKYIADVNGDGLSDIVHLWDNSGGLAISVYESDGVGFKASWDTHQLDSAGFYGDKYIADVNGDGRSDIVHLWDNSGGLAISVYESDGKAFKTSWWTHQLDSAGFYGDKYIADISGNGAADIVHLWNNNGKLALSSYLTDGRYPSIFSVSNGENQEVTYKTEQLNRIVTSIPTPESYPEVGYQGSLKVVTSVTTDNGIGGTNTATYAYEGMKIHLRGLGSLGFNKITTENQTTGFTNTTIYSQDWENRTVGLVEEQWTTAPNGTVISSVYNTFKTNQKTETGGEIYFPYVYKSSTYTRDLNNVFTGQTTVKNTFDLENNLTETYTCASSLEKNNFTTCLDFGVAVPLWTRINYDYYDQSLLPNMPQQLKQSTIKSGSVQDPLGKVRTTDYHYHWSQGGALKSKTLEPGTDSWFKTEYTYHTESGLIDTVTTSGYDMLSNTTKTEFNSNGTLDTKTAGYGNQDLVTQYFYINTQFPWLPTGVRTPNTPAGIAKSVTTDYDSFGRAYQTTSYLSTVPVTTTTTRTWCSETSECHTYLGEVYIEKVTSSAKGTSASIIYDILGREVRRTSIGYNDGITSKVITTDTEYNHRGQVASVSLPYFDVVDKQVISSEYDDLGRPITIINAAGYSSSVVYDGRTVTTTNPKGQFKRVETNYLGQKKQVTDALWNTIDYEYDAFGKLTLMTDEAGNQTTMVYNSRGFKTDMFDPDTGKSTYTYDGAGRLRTQTDNKGQVSEIVYDNLGRRDYSIDDKNGANIRNEMTYYITTDHHNGKLKEVSGNGFKEEYTYDGYGRPYQTITTIEGVTYTSSKTYDNIGRPKYLTYPNSNLQVDNIYDDYTGILKQVKNANNGTVYWQATYQAANGTMEAYTLDGDIHVTNHHEPDTGFISSINVHREGGSNIVNLVYQHDSIGNLTQRTDYINMVGDHDIEYDDLNRVKSTRQTRTNSSGYFIDFPNEAVRYDALGNILYKSDLDPANNGADNYAYNGTGCSGLYQTCPHAASTIAGENYLYDANGNMTSGGGRTIAYTAFNKPFQITKDNTNTSTFTYGPTHSRYKRVDSGTNGNATTLYLQGLAEKVTEGGITKTKLYVGNFAVVTQESGQSDKLNYMLHDHLGSLIAVTEADGTVVQRYSYDLWGKRRDVRGISFDENQLTSFVALVTQRSYTGHEYLDEVGLIHMNGRVYDPRIARFLSADPFVQDPGNLQSLNRYSYVMNNPLRYTDPSGYLSLSDLDPTRGVKKLNDHRKSANRQVLRTYKQLVSSNPLLHYGGKALKRSKNLQQLGRVVAGVADLFGCSGYCSAGYSAHLATIQGGSPTDVTLAGFSGYAMGQMAIGGYGQFNQGPAAFTTWMTDRYIDSKIGAEVSRFIVNNTNLSYRDLAIFSAGMQLLSYSRNAKNMSELRSLGIDPNNVSAEELIDLNFVEDTRWRAKLFHIWGDDNSGNRRFTSNNTLTYGPIEAILTTNGALELSPIAMGTYNFGNITSTHIVADLVPYLIYGNTFSDPSGVTSRLYQGSKRRWAKSPNSGFTL